MSHSLGTLEEAKTLTTDTHSDGSEHSGYLDSSSDELELDSTTSLLPDRHAHNLGRLGVHPHPQGGLDVVVAAPHAKAVDFCVQSSPASPEVRYRLFGPIQGCWHGYFSHLQVGTRYGFRAYGAWDVDSGLFYNPAKLLLDPYGRGISGTPKLSAALHAHQVDKKLHPIYPLSRSTLDSKYVNAWSVVTDTGLPLAPAPQIPWEQTVIYELHVVGFTKRMLGIPKELRGTYAGLSHPVAIKYLRELGVNAVELLPVHAKMSEPFLTGRGLENYWGYSTLSYFAPESSYATLASQKAGAQAVVDEFRHMVSELHEAGIEVLLDVVYNHTCEGGNPGISVSWRGLDPLMYYRHTNTHPHVLIDDTGCGNTLNSLHPRVVQMILDSLRYWVQEMGVDGFRFDLATALGRVETGFTPFHPLFVGIAQDPVLQNVKMIAEPWDVGPGGWQTSGFPNQFSEWNDRYRDTLRRFWLTDYATLTSQLPSGNAADLATRLSGSADMFWHPETGRNHPRASINFLTSHDGFTLADLTRYNEKHNHANLEDNRDGTTNNLSWNHGFEGVIKQEATVKTSFTRTASTGERQTQAAAKTKASFMAAKVEAAESNAHASEESNPHTGLHVNENGDNNADVHTNPHASVDANADADARMNTDVNAHVDARVNAYTDTDTNSDTNAALNADTHTNVSTNSSANTTDNTDGSAALDLQQVSANRLRSHKNLLASLLISAGTPMLVAGDEFARTQHGNNNAYCQNNEISWIDWNLDSDQKHLLQSTKFLLALRQLHPVLRPQHFFTGHAKADSMLPDVSWLNRAGKIIDSHQWHDLDNRLLQMRRASPNLHDAHALVVINGLNKTETVTLGSNPARQHWSLVFDSTWPTPAIGGIRSSETAVEDGLRFSSRSLVRIDAFSLQIYLSTQY